MARNNIVPAVRSRAKSMGPVRRNQKASSAGLLRLLKGVWGLRGSGEGQALLVEWGAGTTGYGEVAMVRERSASCEGK